MEGTAKRSCVWRSRDVGKDTFQQTTVHRPVYRRSLRSFSINRSRISLCNPKLMHSYPENKDTSDMASDSNDMHALSLDVNK